MCFSGCQGCLAVQCKQIAAFILFSQHLPSPVIQLKVLACTICSRAAVQAYCDANAGVKLVERAGSWMKAHCTVPHSEFIMGEVD